MRIDPKQLKGGTLTGNITLTGSFSLPSLLSETTSLDFLALSSDNSIKKRTLGTMALLSSTNFYDKTNADSTFLKLTGGVMSGTLTVNAQVNVGSTLNITGSDLTIRNAARGVGGRALVHDSTNGVTINYANDFTGGVTIGSNVFFSNTAPSYLLNVNFGIGTATPSEKLSVLGNISTTGMFKLNGSFGTTGQFIKNTGILSEWASITPTDITGLYLGTRTLMEDTRTSFGNSIYSYRVYSGQTTNLPTGLLFGQILNWGGGTTGGQAQIAVGWAGTDNTYIAFRSLRDTIDNWYSWKRIYHEGYKPSVSDITGLATYNGLTNYLPLSGGELSGTLIINKTASNSLQAGPGIYFYGGTSFSQLQQGVGRLSFWGYNGSIWKENFSVQNSTGNVGIGTTTESGYKLDVNGTARFTGNVNFNTHIILNNDRWIYWKDTSGADRRFLALSTNNSFYVGDIDNVIAGGVNNFFANQQHNFFVNNDLKIQLTNGWNYFKGHIQAYGVANAQLRSQSNDTIPIVGKIQSVDGNSVWMGSESNHYLNFITNNAIRATIDTTGNFGIGITTPSSLGLQIHKGSISAGITLSNAVNNWSLYTGDTTNAFIITDNQWGERFRISANGNVGIGTSTINRKLTVYSATNDVYASFRTASSLQEGMLFGLGTNNQGVIYNSENTPIEFYTNRTLVGTVLANGYWGIGTTPLAKLHIGGGYGQLNGLAIGSLIANEYGTVLFTENYGNGVTHLFSLKNEIGYGDIALAEYGGRVGIGTDRPICKLDVRGDLANFATGDYVNGTTGSALQIQHGALTGNSYSDITAFQAGGSLYANLVLARGGNVGIGQTNPIYKLDVLGNTRIDGYLRMGDNIGMENNKYLYWKDTTGTDRRFIGFSDGNTLFLGDIDRSIVNSNSVFISDTIWFYCGQANKAVITSSGLDVKGNYYQNGVLKTFFDGNYNSLTNRPDLSGYLTWSNVETAWNGSNWNDTNGNPISVKLVKSIFDGKANTIHTHDWSTITGKPTIFDGNYNNLTNRPDLSGYLTWSNVETAWNGSNWNDTNGNPISVKLVKSIFDGKANTIHTHDWSSITGKPNFFDGNYNNLSNLPNLGSYVLTSSIVQDELSVNATNSNAVSAKVLSATKDNIYANMNAGLSGKANTSHTHDWSTISGKPNFFDGNYNNLSNRPDLSAYLTYGNVETGAFSNDRWISSNTKITSVQFLKGIIDNLQVQLDSKASSFHTHDWSSITGKPTLFDGNYNNLSNKPTLFDGNYYSLSNLPDLGNYLYGSVNASNRFEIMRTISFTSNIEMAALSTPQLVVTSILNCQGQLTVNADMNVMNPKTLTNSQINTTSIVGVYVDFGNKLTRLTLTQFKNLMATV